MRGRDRSWWGFCGDRGNAQRHDLRHHPARQRSERRGILDLRKAQATLRHKAPTNIDEVLQSGGGPALQRLLENAQNGKANGLYLAERAINVSREAAEQVDCEAELVIVMGKTARNVSEADALSYVFGYCTGRDLQRVFTATPEGAIAGYPKEKQVWLKAGDRLTSTTERLRELQFTLA